MRLYGAGGGGGPLGDGLYLGGPAAAAVRVSWPAVLGWSCAVGLGVGLGVGPWRLVRALVRVRTLPAGLVLVLVPASIPWAAVRW